MRGTHQRAEATRSGLQPKNDDYAASSSVVHHPDETNSSGTLKRHLHSGQTSVESFVSHHIAGHWCVQLRQ